MNKTIEEHFYDSMPADIARIHNGGLNGYRKVSTDAYWAKVKAELYRMGEYDLADGKVGFDL